MSDSADYELYDTNFEEWLRKGLESFGMDADHPGTKINHGYSQKGR